MNGCSNPTCSTPEAPLSRNASKPGGLDCWCRECVRLRVRLRSQGIAEIKAHREARARGETFGQVYIIIDPRAGLWKIGHTTSLKRRLREARTWVPDLAVVALVPGGPMA